MLASTYVGLTVWCVPSVLKSQYETCSPFRFTTSLSNRFIFSRINMLATHGPTVATVISRASSIHCRRLLM
jgi:hypothetical protein